LTWREIDNLRAKNKKWWLFVPKPDADARAAL
jgi:hypothetical protein